MKSDSSGIIPGDSDSTWNRPNQKTKVGIAMNAKLISVEKTDFGTTPDELDQFRAVEVSKVWELADGRRITEKMSFAVQALEMTTFESFPVDRDDLKSLDPENVQWVMVENLEVPEYDLFDFAGGSETHSEESAAAMMLQAAEDFAASKDLAEWLSE